MRSLNMNGPGPFVDPSWSDSLVVPCFCIEIGDEKIVVDTAGNSKHRPNFEALGNLDTDFMDRMIEAGSVPTM